MGSVLSEYKGFTPVIDVVVEDVGLMTAVVYGRMWRYCQMEDHVCRASMEKIAKEVGVSTKTARRHVKKLCEYGYFRDATPDVRNKPHVYVDTGKVVIRGLIEAKRVDRESDQNRDRVDRESDHGGTESPMKKVFEERKYKKESATKNEEDSTNDSPKEDPNEIINSFGLTGEAYHAKHGGEVQVTQGQQRHADPVNESKESMEKSRQRDKEPPEEAVAKAYAKVVGMNLDSMPENQRESLVRKWKNILDNWGGASKEQALLAWKEWREKYDWKEPQVRYTNFENEYGELLQAVKDGNVRPGNVFKVF